MLNATGASTALAASDLSRAVSFYRDKLGLEPSESDAYAAGYVVGGARFFLYETSYAGTAKNTVMAFEVADLEAEVASLRAAGLVFEEYDMPGLQTVDGIATMEGEKSAWFTDSEGNIIAITQDTR